MAAPLPGGAGRYVALGLVIVLAGVIVAGLLLVSSSPSLSADPSALAKVGMPLGGGTIESATATAAGRAIPLEVRGDQLWPRKLVPARTVVSVTVVVKRPGWISWLSGSRTTMHLSIQAPSAALRAHYLTLKAGAPLQLQFNKPIQVIAYGAPGHMYRHVLASPVTEVNLPRSAEAGTIAVAVAPRAWETSRSAFVSWFPAGASAASAVATPAPGSRITPNTPITLTFSKPVSAALGSARPPISPATQGTWRTLNTHTIVFQPQGYGYGLAATVHMQLPGGVQVVGGQPSWTVPGGSTLREQQILALLGYMPLTFKYTGGGVARTVAAQEAAAVNPPAGSFNWRYADTPASLRGFWAPGATGVITRGALMAFQNEHGLTTDGVAGPAVWRSLMAAVVTGKRSSFGYTYVSVSIASQKLELWHSGRTVFSTPVNTGIASAPTATGTYPVFEHIPSGTMSGTNPDGSHYNDPGIQFISYFNGGDALHAFTRAQYGFPQSLGCVEMSVGSAGTVYPDTPIGTLVHVA
ncbi:MAG TPA: L,D-transpeptidase family protein [Solirubrobacteraceae bacterium]|nr:L,D-transpeptidase family protein [Solirubrobacteraceae bacterium]